MKPDSPALQAEIHPPSTAAPAIAGVRRPVPALLGYYTLQSLLAGPFFPIPLLVMFFRYRSLRYTFDADGVSMRWGILFRREVTLTFARIQDIHLVSNIVERWLGLGRVQVQTASGSAAAEMTIEGLPDFEQVRNELYRRMRGARGQRTENALPGTRETAALPAGDLSDVAAVLHEAAAELRALRVALAARETR